MSDGKNAYKDTLNLPRTDFDMRAGLLKKEPAIQARWELTDLYGRIRQARQGKSRFILHDGPPYANGNIHIGHAMNKTLKDIVVRYRTMTGFDAPIVHGWDCHGQPIEQKIVEELGEQMQGLSAMEIRRRCADYAARFVALQAQQFKRLGVLGNFAESYITMRPEYEAAVLEVLAKMVEQGVVYRQLKPVHWSIENRTALAEAELEYKDRNDESIYVLLEVPKAETVKALFKVSDAAPVYLMIWTTTPWTLPANLAVAVHPDIEYAIVKFNWKGRDVLALLAGELAGKVLALPGVREYKVLGSVGGSVLAGSGLGYLQPLAPGKLCPVVPATYVTLEDGTGLVHTAPGHGLEDYGTALKCGLEIYCPVLDDGTFDKTAPAELIGKSVWEGNELVCAALAKAGALFHRMTISHSYPHDWRSKTPTIFRATEQWFVAVDRPMTRGTNLRSMALEACGKRPDEGGIDFVPAWGRNRLAGMLESRPDWCISRQRSWGLPIPAFYNADGDVLLTPASVRAVARHFAEHGSDSWFQHDAAKLLEHYSPAQDKDLKDPKAFSIGQFKPGRDILDVWFESGSSWYAAAMRLGLVDQIPVDLYLEGSDQHRGWFQLSLLPALAVEGVPPMKTIVTHGWVMDEQGRKMSKSLGNTVDVIEQLQRRGADIIRWWVASQNYQDDVRGSDGLIAQGEDAYRKIRNTLRYCMGACFDFDPAVNPAESAPHSLDRWMRLELHRLIRDVRNAYETYEFHRAGRLMYEFCTVQASSVYMAAVKDRLYCELPDSPRRRATQSVLHEMLVALVKLLAPILPHTAEEAWEYIPRRNPSEPDSVHLSLMPEVDSTAIDVAMACIGNWPPDMRFEGTRIQPSLEMLWDMLMDLRGIALAKLEALRNAGVKNPLDAEAIFTVAQDNALAVAMLESYLPELEDLLGVGYARIEKAPGEKLTGEKTYTAVGERPIAVRVEDARGKYKRCARSWKRRPDVGSNGDYPDLSARDADVVWKLSRQRKA
jgi:isoleucyl-tRNA synthetase